MKLIVGLGNPGEKFQRTRHNLGFLVIEELAKIFKIKKSEKQALAEIMVKTLNLEKIVLAKPLVFMNNSGQAAKFLTKKFKMSPKEFAKNLFVIHDDIDLPLGTMRINQRRGCAGHKGVLSIINSLGTKDFVRFRIGIYPIGQTFTGNHFKKKITTDKFVLKKISLREQKDLRAVIKNTAKAILTAIKKDINTAMNEFN